jgi:hypothetical protein
MPRGKRPTKKKPELDPAKLPNSSPPPGSWEDFYSYLLMTRNGLWEWAVAYITRHPEHNPPPWSWLENRLAQFLELLGLRRS